MSADLFAEFSATPTNQQQQQQAARPGQATTQPAAAFSFFDDLSAPPAPVVTQEQPHQTLAGVQDAGYGKKDAATVDDNDDWGDFEGGTSAFEPAPSVKQDPFAFSTARTPQPTWPSAPIQSDPFAFSAPQTSQPSQVQWPSEPAHADSFAFTTAQPPQPSQLGWTKAPIIKAKKSADPSVLFDAEDDLDDDDFGDFEGTDSPSTAAAAPTALGGAADLLGDLSLSSKPTPPTASAKKFTSSGHKASTSFSGKKSPVSGFGSVTRVTQSKAGASTPTAKQEDSWDTFDDWEASIPSQAPKKAPSKPKQQSISVGPKSTTSPPILSPTIDDPQPGELPPTNVPPPAVLLTLFPPLFAEAQNKLFKPMAAQTLPMRNKLLSEPATIVFLQGYLMLASVAAQIIAGRKLRWKRDQHLSQGMRIGPASSRATSGMKLSTIDKSENLKEEREASDVVRAWKDQIGRLRHVVSAANQIKAGTLGAVPDIQESMPVKVLKQEEGGVPAPQPCMLCGLRRDERLGAADQSVQDSFGEWWIEQVNMHRGCRNFWNEHKVKLRSR
ncbi:hypothetical protein K458DRAFT_407312 [Lentithecium fluviatile CBS 122367]|uniref:Serine/threonine-protein kinase ppk6 n=1 Tax=Lentithecium fluviatile CBS 122367 TaxID=1168545 RepID=A0A6G1IPV7_9PLEO|nr:hypothetical protein K458DRAFT_407312 [Lentithecium fluviatile CBS 122367]